MKLAKKLFSLTAIAAAVLSSQSSFAADDFINPDWANTATYIGVGVGQSRGFINNDDYYRVLGNTGRINTTSKIWDNVAPHIIATEAGALWTAADGSPIDYSQPLTRTDQNYTFCVAPPALHAQLTKITRHHNI